MLWPVHGWIPKIVGASGSCYIVASCLSRLRDKPTDRALAAAKVLLGHALQVGGGDGLNRSRPCGCIESNRPWRSLR